MTARPSIIYARVSTAIQDTDRQVVDLQAYANGNDYSVERIFTEKISGAKKNSERPALMDALEYATKHKCTILCSELSRLGRNIDEILKSIIFCKEHKTNVYFQKEQLSIFNNDGEEHPFLMIMIATLGTCAKLEREAIRFRMKSGYDKFRAEGGKVGRKRAEDGLSDDARGLREEIPQVDGGSAQEAEGEQGQTLSGRFACTPLSHQSCDCSCCNEYTKRIDRSVILTLETKRASVVEALLLGYSDSNQE